MNIKDLIAKSAEKAEQERSNVKKQKMNAIRNQEAERIQKENERYAQERRLKKAAFIFKKKMKTFQTLEDSFLNLVASCDETDGSLSTISEHEDIMFKIEELLLLGRSLWDTPDEVIAKALGFLGHGVFRTTFIFNIHSLQKIKTMHTMIVLSLGIEHWR